MAISFHLKASSTITLENIRRQIDAELEERRSRVPLSSRIVLKPPTVKPTSITRSRGRRQSPKRSPPKKSPIRSPPRKSPPKRSPPKKSPIRSPPRKSPPKSPIGGPPGKNPSKVSVVVATRKSPVTRTIKKSSPRRTDKDKALETIVIDFPEGVNERVLVEELNKYGTVLAVQILRNESDEVLNIARVRFDAKSIVNALVKKGIRIGVLAGSRIQRTKKGLSTVQELDEELEEM